jgi:hypothetical protein
MHLGLPATPLTPDLPQGPLVRLLLG